MRTLSTRCEQSEHRSCQRPEDEWHSQSMRNRDTLPWTTPHADQVLRAGVLAQKIMSAPARIGGRQKPARSAKCVRYEEGGAVLHDYTLPQRSLCRQQFSPQYRPHSRGSSAALRSTNTLHLLSARCRLCVAARRCADTRLTRRSPFKYSITYPNRVYSYRCLNQSEAEAQALSHAALKLTVTLRLNGSAQDLELELDQPAKQVFCDAHYIVEAIVRIRSHPPRSR